LESCRGNNARKVKQLDLGMRSKTSREEWFDEECRLAIQENNKAGEKVTECNTKITCRRI